MSFLDLVKKNILASVAIGVGAVAVIFGGVSWITYSAQYNAESRKTLAAREALNAKLPKLPEEVVLDNAYVVYDDDDKTVSSTKSNFKKSFVFEAETAVVSPNDPKKPASIEGVEGTAWNCIAGLNRAGGKVSFTIATDHYGKSDIDIVLANTWKNSNGEMQTIDNISDYIKIEINGLLVKTEDLEIPDSGDYQHVILKDTHLMEGDNTLDIKSAEYNTLGGSDLYVMPNIRNIAVIADVNIDVPEIPTAE